MREKEMNLEEWFSKVNIITLFHGEELYRGNHISALKFSGNKVEAVVEGDQTHTVTATVDEEGETVVKLECTCHDNPSEEICVHETALLFLLDKPRKKYGTMVEEAKAGWVKENERINEEIDSLSADELRDVLKKMVFEDRRFRDYFKDIIERKSGGQGQEMPK